MLCNLFSKLTKNAEVNFNQIEKKTQQIQKHQQLSVRLYKQQKNRRKI